MIRTMYINGEEIYHTYGLWLESKSIPLPQPRMRFVEIEGGNGSIDLSTALTNGHMRYDDREAQFVVTNLTGDYVGTRNELALRVHGKRCRVEVSDEPGHYYMGRLWVSEWNVQAGDVSVFALDARLDPFKYSDTRLPATEVSRTNAGTRTVTLTNQGAAPSAVMTTATVPDGGQIDMMWPEESGILYRLFPGENDLSLILDPGESVTARVTFGTGGGNLKFELEERSI